MHPFLVALQFLTRLPLPHREAPTDEERGRSLLWFPAVGLLIGLLLWLLNGLVGGAGDLVAAALLLVAWVLITGGLHLDGLADTADAWVGGHGDRERTLAILKDPYAGPNGVAAVVLVLLVKFAALTALAGGPLLWLAPFAARTLVLGLYLTTPYVRSGGLGEGMHAALPAKRTRQILVVAGVAVVLFYGGAGLAAVAVAAGWLLLLRSWLLTRLGGTTGDTTGALIEIGEALVLVTLALV